MTNPFLDMSANTAQRLTMALDAVDNLGGRGKALQLLGVPSDCSNHRTAEILHQRYGSVERVVAKLNSVRLGMDGLITEPSAAIPTLRGGGNGKAGSLSPEDALKALASRDDGEAILTAEGSTELERDPRLNAFRAQMSEQDFQSLLRLIRDTRRQFEQPLSRTAQDRFDSGVYQLTSPYDKARFASWKQKLARSVPRVAQDSANSRAVETFLELFPNASFPETRHY